MLRYYVFRLATLVVPHLPRRPGLAVCAWVGAFASRLAPSRHAVRDNMRHVVGPEAGEAELDRLVRGVFRYQLRNYFDLFHLPGLSEDDVSRIVNADELADLSPGFEDGRGVVAVAPHYGNVDVTAQMVGILGLDAFGVVERLEPEALFRLVGDLRATHGVVLVPVDQAPKQIFRALRTNGMVFLAADRDVTGSASEVDFFGAPALLPTGYAQVARRTGARVAVISARRLPDDTFVVRTWLLPRIEPTADRAADEAVIVRRVLEVVEGFIAEQPEQWVLFQRVWPDRPAGDSRG